jgi:hypothetical protein
MQTPPKNAGDNQDARDGFLHDTKVLLTTPVSAIAIK